MKKKPTQKPVESKTVVKIKRILRGEPIDGTRRKTPPAGLSNSETLRWLRENR